MNEDAYRLESELGYTLASDTRGTSPYFPVDGRGEILGPLQLPTTLPTLDELLGRDGWDERSVHRPVMEATDTGAGLHVYTLHAELEGQKLLPCFERLIAGWKAQGHVLVSLGDAAAALDGQALPKCIVATGAVEGRSGDLAVQGRPVHAAAA